MKSKIKIWAGVGTYVLAGVGTVLALSEIASVSAIPASADQPQMLISQSSPAPTVPTSGGEGGEGGGEGGEGGGEGGEGGGEGGEGGGEGGEGSGHSQSDKSPTTFTPNTPPAAPASQGGEGAAPPVFQDKLSGAALVNVLRGGG